MGSPFWRYFHDKLNWLPIHNAGPLSAIAKGLALHLDEARSDILWLREQWHPAKCEDESVAGFGKSRRVIRHAKENPQQFRKRVTNAWAWHMLGGKTLGLPEILKFYGFDAISIESLRGYQPSRWAEFQLGLKTPKMQSEQQDLLDNLDMLIWLVNEYKPARSILARVFTDTYNLTPAIWSGPKDRSGWGMGFWSDFSGVRYEADNNSVVVSFGMAHRIQPPQRNQEDCGFGIEHLTGILAPYLDRPVWSRSFFGDEYPKNHGFTIGEMLSLHWCARVTSSWLWDRVLPKWKIRSRSFAKVHAVLSWAERPDGAYGDINACYGRPRAAIFTGSKWGDAWGHDPERRDLEILERWREKGAATVDPVRPRDPSCSGLALMMGASSPLHDTGWRGGWSKSRWSKYMAQLSTASEEI